MYNFGLTINVSGQCWQQTEDGGDSTTSVVDREEVEPSESDVLCCKTEKTSWNISITMYSDILKTWVVITLAVWICKADSVV